MKKILLLATVLFGLNTITNAQVSVTEDNDVKNFRFGLLGGLSMDWLNVDNDKKFEKGGMGLGNHWGLQLEFKLNNTLSIISGLSLTSNNLKLNYNTASSADTVLYILDKDEAFVDFPSDSAEISSTMMGATNNVYWLQNRKIKANYVNIPIALKMKTKEIGYITYFGQFGANIGIKTGAKTDDIVQKAVIDTTGAYTFNSETIELSKLDVSKAVQPVRVGLKIGFGAEYNISGTTSIYAELNYNHYFTNALRKESNETYLNKYDYADERFENVGAKVIPGSVSLTVGILF